MNCPVHLATLHEAKPGQYFLLWAVRGEPGIYNLVASLRSRKKVSEASSKLPAQHVSYNSEIYHFLQILDLQRIPFLDIHISFIEWLVGRSVG